MSEDTRFVTSNKDKAIFEFRSEVDNHLAPNVTLISSDNVKVKCHSIILGSCHYFRALFNKDKTGNSHLVYHESFTGGVLELVVKYIYTGEYSLLDVEKLPEVIRAISKEKFNIPALAKGYLLKQLDVPGGLNQSNWHLFYQNGIKLNLGEEYCNRIFAFLKEEHPEFYKSRQFKDLTFEQICKIMKSPNRPFDSNTTIMEASFVWTNENKVGMDKLAELSKICINLVQNGNTSPQAANSPILDASVQSASTQACPQSTLLSDPHCNTTRKRGRPISHQINTQNVNGKRSNKRPNLNGISVDKKLPKPIPQPQSLPKSNPTPSTRMATRMKTRANSLKNGSSNLNKRSNVVEVYHPPKYSWKTAQLLFFCLAEKSEPDYLLSYSFQTGEIKKIAKLPIKNLEDSSLLVSQDRIYSIGGCLKPGYNYKYQDLVRSYPIRDLENLNKAWDEEPNLKQARCDALTLLFRNTIYLFPKNGYYNFVTEKWDMEGNPGIWENNIWNMLYNRDSFGVALLDNIIYMVGGSGVKKGEIDSQNSILDTVESYNIDDGTQTLLPNMNQARSDLRVVALKEQIYAIGGLRINDEGDDYEKLASVESYKPGDASWKQVASMNQPRANGIGAFVLDDKIYVIGGEGWGIKPTMERYCSQEDTWTMVGINLPQWAKLSSSVLLGSINKI